MKMSKKTANKYVSRWFSRVWTEDDCSFMPKSFSTKEEAHEYTKRILEDRKNKSTPFTSIWERKYPLLNLAAGVSYGNILELLRKIKEQLNEPLKQYSDGYLKLSWENFSTKEQDYDLLERIKKTITAWQQENNIIIVASYPVEWCAGDGVELIQSNWSDRKWDDGDKAGIAEEIKL